MPLKPKDDARALRPNPVSFRITNDALLQLKTLTKLLNMTQAEVIEALILQEYSHHSQKNHENLQKARKQISK